jgi:hypothetical protein
MFPNVRLMIAASLASVVALICGFGTFAAFQVSHEPLVRLPSASAPLQLSPDNGATPMAYAAPEPFDRRFQISEAKNAAEAVDAFTRAIEHRESLQSALSPAPEPGATEAVAPPADKPSEKSAAPAADDHMATVSVPQPAPPAGIAEAPAASPDSAKPEPAASAVATAPGVATIEPPAEQSLPQEQLKPGNEAVPASVTDAEKADTAAAKETRHRHAARIRHAKIASRKTKEPSSATGGPFVSAPGQ